MRFRLLLLALAGLASTGVIYIGRAPVIEAPIFYDRVGPGTIPITSICRHVGNTATLDWSIKLFGASCNGITFDATDILEPTATTDGSTGQCVHQFTCTDPANRSTSVHIVTNVYGECNDGIDNDGDGLIDWNGGPSEEPPDPGCAGDPFGANENEPPMVDAGPDQSIGAPGTLNADATITDAEDGTPDILWELTTGGACVGISITNNLVEDAAFPTDGTEGVCVARVTATDSHGASAFDTMLLVVEPSSESMAYADTFTRANSTDLTANCDSEGPGGDCGWLELGNADWSISSNTVVSSAATGQIVGDAGSALGSQAQYSAARFVGADVANVYSGPILLATGGSGALDSFYTFRFDSSENFTVLACHSADICYELAQISNADMGGAMAPGDSIGFATNGGAGDSVQFSLWRWADQAPPARASWGTPTWTVCAAACDQFMIAAPSETEAGVASGDRGGLYSGQTSIAAWDNWMAGTEGAITNQAPIANAGAEYLVTPPETSIAIDCSGSTDDGLPNPPGVLTCAWSIFSGLSGASITNAEACETTLTSVSADGVIECEVSDSLLTDAATADVIVSDVLLLQWSHPADEDVDGFLISWGTASGIYTTEIDVGLPTPDAGVYSYSLTLPGPGTYYLSARAYGGGFNVSPYATEREEIVE